MKFDVKSFRKTRSKEMYQPAEMTCIVSDSFRVTNPVRVKARGIYRRDNCMMPPLWLNIRYSGIENEELMGIRRMKMVTRCRNTKLYADYVLREYLIYKIYNLVTPYSYRVRLINLNQESQYWAFLIEPDAMMANRLRGQLVKSDALPGEAFGIKSVRERYFLGPCRTKSFYLEAISELESVLDEIKALIWSFDCLDEESRFDMIGYIESFFNTAQNERFIERNITTSCR